MYILCTSRLPYAKRPLGQFQISSADYRQHYFFLPTIHITTVYAVRLAPLNAFSYFLCKKKTTFNVMYSLGLTVCTCPVVSWDFTGGAHKHVYQMIPSYMYQ